MDDKDRYDPQTSDPEDDVEKWPAGLIANHATGAEVGSSNQGTLAGGVVGAAQAGRIEDAQEPEEERSVQVPAIPDNTDKPGIFGHQRRLTGDEGVSPQQREAESDELNG